MGVYRTFLEREGLPKWLIEFSEGRITLPDYIWATPAEPYTCPPVLVPLASEGSSPSYLGYWRPWFVGRQPSFVNSDIEDHNQPYEVARTPEQLALFAFISAAEPEDDIDSSDFLRRLADSFQISSFDRVADFVKTNGDNPAKLPLLAEFAQRTPLKSIRDVSEYDGNFAAPGVAGIDWRYVSWIELAPDMKASWPAGIERQPWHYRDAPVVRLFDEAMDAGDLAVAWTVLNGTGWPIEQARQALRRMTGLAADPLFTLHAEAWMEFSNDSSFDDGY